MTAADLRNLRWRWITISIVVSAVAVLLVTLYVGSLLQLSAAKWRTFGGFVVSIGDKSCVLLQGPGRAVMTYPEGSLQRGN